MDFPRLWAEKGCPAWASFSKTSGLPQSGVMAEIATISPSEKSFTAVPFFRILPMHSCPSVRSFLFGEPCQMVCTSLVQGLTKTGVINTPCSSKSLGSSFSIKETLPLPSSTKAFIRIFLSVTYYCLLLLTITFPTAYSSLFLALSCRRLSYTSVYQGENLPEKTVYSSSIFSPLRAKTLGQGRKSLRIIPAISSV